MAPSLFGKVKSKGRKWLQAAPRESSTPSPQTLSPTPSRPASQLATRPISQPTPSPPTSTDSDTSSLPSLQERLWNEAYDGLKASEPKLVGVYEKILLAELHGNDPSSVASEPTDNGIASTRGTRCRQIQQLVQEGLDRTQKQASIKQGIDEGLQAVQAVRGIVDKAVQAAPEATITWVGVYLGLEILLNPITEACNNCKGIAYILLRIEWQLFKDGNAWEALSKILAAMLNDASVDGAILIVDALDEYKTNRHQLLDFIIEPSRVKWIVSSCNWLDIEEKLDNIKQNVKLRLELNKDLISKAVDIYIGCKVDQLACEKKYDKETRQAVENHLTSNANGTFLWVALDDGNVYRFIQEKYLYWLECLSLLRSISEGVKAVHKLEALVKNAEAQQLRKLLRDARRFILSNKRPIEIAPLQAYASALVFSPTRSLIRELFEKEEPNWITLKPSMESDWNACLQTLEGHGRSVSSVVFSADGQRLASGSQDKTVKVWDAATGACMQTLKGHGDWVWSVVFSADGQRLASGSWDKTVKVWDAAIGACVQTLEGHGHSVRSVAFSADSQRLASGLSSGSWDKTVKVWDAATGAYIQTLEGHSDWVTSVVFSADSQRLASGSWDKTVKIWDAATGACVQTLEGHGDWVTSVVFSADGQRLASGSQDKMVKIWDAATGVCMQTLNVGRLLYHLSFDPTTNTLLSTDIGLLSLDHPALPPAINDRSTAITLRGVRHSGWGISTDGIWIVKDRKKMLWLPPDYREGESAVIGSTVAIGCRSGRVLVMKFS
ncbi:NWD1 protein [Ilyonectria robusta]